MTGRDNLKRLAEDIAELADRECLQQKQYPFPPSIPFAVSEWFVAAVNAYLAGNKPSMDHALGLVRSRGKPKTEKPAGKNYERAKKIYWMRGGLVGKPVTSWKKIAEKLSVADTRGLQRELNRYMPDILAELQVELEALRNRRDGIK